MPSEPTAAFSLPRPNRTLAALTTSALALPGMATPVRADAPIERATGSTSFSYYVEDDLPDNKLLSDPANLGNSGSNQRYEIFTKQIRFDFPVSERFDVGVDFLYEEMSGASPWFVRADPNNGGQERQVMSGATIEDTRYDATLDLDYYMDRGKDTVSAGFSIEKDYTSMHYGLAMERNFNDKNTILNMSGAFSYDWIEPTDADLFSSIRPEEEEKWTVDLFAGFSQILTRASTAQITLNYKHSDGYLSDPYKAIATIDDSAGLFPDSRPDKREQLTILARYRHHIELLNASAHADYQFHVDNWGIVSHAAEIAWYQNFWDWFTIVPGVRWYSQSQADFYEAVLQVAPTDDASSDFRLSPYGSVSAKIRVDFEMIDLFEYSPPRALEAIGITEGFDLILSLSYERYWSDGHLGISQLQETDEAPGLVNFHVGSFTLSGRF